MILLRRDTFKNWLKHDPILEEGEPAYITNIKRMKVGDGKSTFSELPVIDYVFVSLDISGASNAIILNEQN